MHISEEHKTWILRTSHRLDCTQAQIVRKCIEVGMRAYRIDEVKMLLFFRENQLTKQKMLREHINDLTDVLAKLEEVGSGK